MTGEFLKACREIGTNNNLVQSTGGNISLKIGDEMLIKSSGKELQEVSVDSGVAKVDYKKIKSFIEKAAKTDDFSEKKYIKTLKESMKNEAFPSMETGFHATLESAVVHTHPIAINSLACAKDGRGFLEKALGEKYFIWANYSTPGVALSCNISKIISNKKDKSVIIIENHGMIVSGTSIEKCVAKTISLEKKAAEYLNKKIKKVFNPGKMNVEKLSAGKYIIRELDSAEVLENLLQGVLFPDAAVHFENTIALQNGGKLSIVANNAKKEKRILDVFLAHLAIMLNSMQLREPQFLSSELVKQINDLEMEKGRKEGIGK